MKQDPRLKKTGVTGYNKPKRTPSHLTKSHVDFDSLCSQLRDMQFEIMDAIRKRYPIGSRVVFWRSANQKNESFGTVMGHSMSHGPELRVRYDGSDHVVGLHVGQTRFHDV